jgi:signal transduction histidine kinase
LTAIQAAVRNRRKFDLTPLPVAQLPSEIRPLVESFNHLLDQLDQAMQGERRFIGDAAHELRTPLSALQAQAQVALRATTLADKDAALAKLLAVAERSTRLSDQLLDLARMDAGVHVPQKNLADLSELIMHVGQEFDMQAQQQRRSIILALTPCPIECDVDEIGILLRNLLDNALRYTAEDGRVKISCGYTEHAGEDRVCLEVADDGPGVPEAEHEAIFRRFHRVAGNNGRGSGIGLSLVAGIAQLHDAAIKTGPGLDGRGFSVRILFPLPPASSSGGVEVVPAQPA